MNRITAATPVATLADAPLLTLRDVTCSYGHDPVLHHVDLDVGRRQFTGIVGPSGSGKTTLLKVLLGTMAPSSGTVHRAGGLRVGYVPQVETVDWNFPVTVAQCVLMARTHGRVLPWPSRAERSDMIEVLDRLGIGALADRHIRQLSGGQQQRVFVARALLGDPQLLLMDEPTSGVDARTRHDVLHLLDDLNQAGTAIVLTTHDLNGIASHLPHLVCLNTSVVGSGTPLEVLTADVLEQTFGARMEVLQHAGMTVVLDQYAHLHHRVLPLPIERVVIDQLLRPFEFEFFRNGLIVATFAGALCGMVGVYVVLKGMSYIGHGLSHAIFGGFAASALLGVNFIVGAGVWGAASALMINGVTRRRTIGADAAIGVITTASFALGLAMFAVFGRRGNSFDAALFGSILGVDRRDVIAVIILSILVATAVFLGYRHLLFATFDPEVAEASGVRVARVDAAMMLVLATVILATMQVLGVTLIAATLVIPATVARMLTDSFSKMLLLATAIGAASGFVGMNLSYHLDIQSGPSIVLVGAALFAVVFAATGIRGRTRAAAMA